MLASRPGGQQRGGVEIADPEGREVGHQPSGVLEPELGAELKTIRGARDPHGGGRRSSPNRKRINEWATRFTP